MSSQPQGFSTRRGSKAHRSSPSKFGESTLMPLASSRRPAPRAPVGMPAHELLGAAQVFRRVDRQPDAVVAVTAELALGRELGKGALLVIALLGQPFERLRPKCIDTGVHPVRE